MVLQGQFGSILIILPLPFVVLVLIILELEAVKCVTRTKFSVCKIKFYSKIAKKTKQAKSVILLVFIAIYFGNNHIRFKSIG